MAGGGMSRSMCIPANGVHCRPQDEHTESLELKLFVSFADTVGVSTSVRPGRVRSRTKTELDEKIKKPADGIRKKSPPARKTPARGRYVDEYARPAC